MKLKIPFLNRDLVHHVAAGNNVGVFQMFVRMGRKNESIGCNQNTGFRQTLRNHTSLALDVISAQLDQTPTNVFKLLQNRQLNSGYCRHIDYLQSSLQLVRSSVYFVFHATFLFGTILLSYLGMSFARLPRVITQCNELI